MTDTSTPAVLRHGPLTADMVPLLKAGSSVLCFDGEALFTFIELREDDDDMVIGAWLTRFGEAGPTCHPYPENFTYIGERDDDGWITAPEGGWTENPAGSNVVDVRFRDGTDGCWMADEPSWHELWRESITSFRLSDQPVPTEGVTASGSGFVQEERHCECQYYAPCGTYTKPVENSPIPALGGYEPKANEPNPPPVRGLEPVAWRWRFVTSRNGLEWSDWHFTDDRSELPLPRDYQVVEPLYSASDVSALQGALADATRLIGTFVSRYGDMQDGNGNTPTEIRRAKRFLEALGEQQ